MACGLFLGLLGMGDTELMLVLAVILIFFGGSRMPELARGLGKALREFRRATGDVEREFRRVMDEAEHQTITPIKTAFETPDHVKPAVGAASGMARHGQSISAPGAGAGAAAPPPEDTALGAAGSGAGLAASAPAAQDSSPTPMPQGHRPAQAWQPHDPAEEFHSDI